MDPSADETRSADGDFAQRVRRNQGRLGAELRPHYDFVVCGSGSSGSVVAGRLAEDPDVSVLLIEAGGDDDVPAVMRAENAAMNLGGERDWNFTAQPSPHVNGRAIPMNMGKVLGGGSSINVMVWSRGHQSDWDYFAAEAGDSAWNYESVLGIYRRIEDWHGAPDPEYRGAGGPVFVEPAPDPNPIAPAALEGARSVGIPTFENQNGRMMQADAGASIVDLRARNGIRQSVFRSYVYPYMDRPNLTVLTDALVTRVTLDRNRATGVEFGRAGSLYRVGARGEVVLSLGAIHTPKVLMQSGIGEQTELQRFGIPVVQHLPGVGRNLQDHPRFGCVWEYQKSLPPRNNGAEATFFAKSDPTVETPDLQACLGESPLYCSNETADRFGLPEFGFTWAAGVVRPNSRGQVRLTGPHPNDPVRIEADMLSHPDDMAAAMACVELCREIGNSAALRAYVKREVMPGNLTGTELADFLRDAALSYWHQTGTAKMGQDAMSVVDAELKVYGIENLRIADGSIMPRVTTGNTMAPCVVIGERAAEMLKARHTHTEAGHARHSGAVRGPGHSASSWAAGHAAASPRMESQKGTTAMSSSVDDEIDALRTRLAQVLDPSAYPSLSQARRAQEEYGTSVPLPTRIERTSVTLGSVPTERLSPHDRKGQQALLFFHSGGYTSGTAADHAALTAHLALAADAVGYVPEYRRAPEYRFPAALEDAMDSYRALLEGGFSADRVVVAGDSAGGGMAVAVAQQAPVWGLPKPAGIYALSPWVDLTVTNASYDLRGPHDPMLSRTALAEMAHVYLNGADPRHPLASPVFGDFSGFPPLLIHVGADEVLLDDASALAAQASRTGTDVTLRVWARMIHMFPWFSAQLQTGRVAIEQAGQWISGVMAPQ